MPHHRETHKVSRLAWLRAAVLGANDGITSTASLVIGVSASGAPTSAVLLAGAAGLVAGAMSMAAGEYVSVSAQSDTERHDLARERAELAHQPEAELEELAQIYMSRGVDAGLARAVAQQLTKHDALGAHARDELAITEDTAARPILAAFSSAASFALGAAIPVLLAAVVPPQHVLVVEFAGCTALLAGLGWLSSAAGGAPRARSIGRIVGWGLLAMAVTAGVGRLIGHAV